MQELDSLLKSLAGTPQEKKPKTLQEEIDELLGQMAPPPVPEPIPVKPVAAKPGRQLNSSEMASSMLKGLGAGIVRGALDIPASIGDWMTKRGWAPHLMLRSLPGTAVVLTASPKIYAEASQIAEREQLALRTGIFTPEMEKRLAETGAAISKMPGWSASGRLVGNAPDILAASPDAVGQLAGSIVPQSGMYSGVAQMAKVAAAKTVGQRVARHLAASTIATAASSYLINLRDGESSWMRVVRDMGINAAFESVGLPALRKAWRAELTAPDVFVKDIAKRTGLPPELVELKATQVRAGGGVAEPTFAQVIVDAGKKNPEIAKSPIGFQAKKSLHEYWSSVVPDEVKVNSTLPRDHGVSFNVEVDGKQVAQMQIQGSKAQPNHFVDRIDAVAKRVAELSAEGKTVRLTAIQVSHPGTYSRFIRRLRGEPAQYGKMDARTLTQFEQNLGTAAPRGTFAESGAAPDPGTKVVITEPNKPQRVATVEPASEPGKIAVKDPVTNNVEGIPTRYVRSYLYEKKIPQKFSAHSDGTPRHMVFELNSKEAFIEGVDEHTKPSWYRGDFFSAIDRDADFNTGPRGFINVEGNVTLSIQKGDRLTTYLNEGPQADFAPLDLLESKRPLYPSYYRTPKERVAYAMSLGSEVEPRPRSGKMKPVERRLKSLHPETGEPQVERKMKFVGTQRILATDVPKTPVNPVVAREDKGLVRRPGEYHVRVENPWPETSQQFKAGLTPRKMQTESVSRNPYDPRDISVSKIPVSPQRRLLPGPEEQLTEPPVVTASAKGTKHARFKGGRLRPSVREPLTNAYSVEDRILKDSTHLTQASNVRFVEKELPPRYSIARRELIDDPAMVDARDAARILVQTKNMDPGTKVRLIVTDTIHAEASDNPFEWTLAELANFEPGLFDMPELHVAARRRGYRAIPNGVGVILKDMDNGSEVAFKHRLEAASFLQKQRLHTLGPKLESQAEDILRLGWTRSFDGAVDGGDFVSKDAQTIAMNALAQNQRAGVKIWVDAADVAVTTTKTPGRMKSKSGGSIRTPGTVKKEVELVGGPEGEHQLYKAMRELEVKLGVNPHTFRILPLDMEQQGKAAVFIYNRNSADKLREVYGKQIERLLKVPASSTEAMVNGLALRKAGLEILSSPDPESSIIYAYAKNTNQQELMLSGKQMEDAVTGRVYRLFDPQVKAQLLRSQQQASQLPAGSPPAQQPPPPLDPDTFHQDVELKDVVRVPKMDFEGVDPADPPSIMEPWLKNFVESVEADKAAKKPVWSDAWANWFKPRFNLYRDWERKTGVPFYRHFMDVVRGVDGAKYEMAGFRTSLDKIRGAVRKRADRTDVQLLFEARVSKRAEEAKQLAAKMSPQLIKATDDLEDAWRKFADVIEMSPADLEEAVGDLFLMRKLGGNFKSYVGSRSALPRMWSVLRKQMELNNSPITINERETDFWTLGTRLARLLTYERHVTPAFNDAMKKMEDYAKATNMPSFAFNNWKSFAHTVAHTPQESLEASSHVMRDVMRRLKGLIGYTGAKGFELNESESFDLLGAFTALNYAAQLTANPSSVIQQYLQLVQTTTPLLQQYTKPGLKAGVRWLRDPVLQQDMVKRGIGGRTSVTDPLSMLTDFTQSGNRAVSGAAFTVNKIIETGNHPFQVADDFVRVVAYMGKHTAIMEHGPEYLKTRATDPMAWQTFRERTLLDIQDHRDGPITKMVKAALDEGDVQLAAHRAAEAFQIWTNYQYARGVGVRALDGGFGRLLGMFGTWPFATVNLVRDMAMTGDAWSTNRVKALAIVFGTAVAGKAAMEQVFDADSSKWALWKASQYRGGPYAELAMELLYVNSAREEDPVAKIYMARIQQQLMMGIVPGTRAGLKFKDAADALLNEGDWQKASRVLMGLPEAKGGGGQWPQ